MAEYEGAKMRFAIYVLSLFFFSMWGAGLGMIPLVIAGVLFGAWIGLTFRRTR